MDKWLAPVFNNLTTEFSDCTIIVGNQSFDCHKVILASASGFFKTMFLCGLKESTSNEIHLENVTPETFEKFRSYVYTYNERALNAHSTSDLMDLYECANQWFVSSLMSDCIKLLIERAQSMPVEDLIELYEWVFNFDIKELLPKICYVMNTKHFKNILCENALLLGSDVFLNYLTTVAKGKSEIQRFVMIEKYLEINGFLDKIIPEETPEDDVIKKLALMDIKSQDRKEDIIKESEVTVENPCIGREKETAIKNKKKQELNTEYVKSLLGTIHYSKMSSSEFYHGPGKSKLLTFQIKYELLYIIHLQESKIK